MAKEFRAVTFASLKSYLAASIPPNIVEAIFTYLKVSNFRSDID